MNLNEIIKAARGEKPADLLITNARIINVFTGDIVTDSFAVSDGYIIGFGDYQARKIIDVQNRFVAPGFIDPHLHIESSMACLTEFARAVLVHGTTSVVADPHEIANVLGKDGITYMLQSAEGQPMNFYFTLSSCVPATDMETSGAIINAADLKTMMGNERIVALAEMMNFPGVINGNPEVLAKIEAARQHRKPIDGHAPGLTGQNLYAYLAAGVRSDHECTTAHEAQEKLKAGMHIMIRQATGARNLKELLPVVNDKTARRVMLCTDDRHPHDLLEDGHIDAIVREAIGLGLDPVMAIQMVTVNAAEYFRLDHLGAVAPGRQADFMVFADLSSPIIEQVYYRGFRVAENGEMRPEIETPQPIAVKPSMNVKLKKIDFSIPAESKQIRVIDIVPDQIVTQQGIEDAMLSGGLAVSDPSRDLLKIAVVERHKGTGNVGKAFLRGLGLKRGALASSVAHDSHNIIVVGTTDADMKTALEAVVEMGGGLAAVLDSIPVATLPLPIAGLMSLDPVPKIREQMDRLIAVSHELGSTLNDPFMTLSFLALPVIPELKITDIGLIDVNQFKVVPLFVDA
ncbi:MAG: adenine deaminase [Desulfobacterales bacterium]|nr:MAG: adenine deaminase [Desulfobacterales bacterium]